LGHVPASQVHDLPWHRGREQHGLALGWEHGNNSFNIREETHVEHFVSFIHDEYADTAQVKISAVGEIKDSPRGSHNDINAGLECINLRFNCATAVYGKDANSEILTGN
jgi:hypothetical protein